MMANNNSMTTTPAPVTPRRSVLGMVAAVTAVTAAAAATAVTVSPRPKPRFGELKSMTTGAQPISAPERIARITKLQGLMQQQKIAALVVESGSTLDYFTGVRW